MVEGEDILIKVGRFHYKV